MMTDSSSNIDGGDTMWKWSFYWEINFSQKSGKEKIVM